MEKVPCCAIYRQVSVEVLIEEGKGEQKDTSGDQYIHIRGQILSNTGTSTFTFGD